jgi:hypothetical protein
VVAALALMLAANLELRTDSPAAESHAVAPQVPHH